jgi:hypothetical protein
LFSELLGQAKPGGIDPRQLTRNQTAELKRWSESCR